MEQKPDRKTPPLTIVTDFSGIEARVALLVAYPESPDLMDGLRTGRNSSEPEIASLPPDRRHEVMNWDELAKLKYKVVGRPLPKGMSKCIVGFVVTKRRKPVVFPF